MYLYLAIDKHGETTEFMLSNHTSPFKQFASLVS